MRQNTIYTVAANCQDCYRCVRACPVKAIKVSGGQAQIQEELCIKCGTCVRECPQNAKVIRSSLDEAKALLASGRKVAASVAPSFAALFSGDLAGRLPSALRRLGFDKVFEAAEGASLVAEKSFAADEKGILCTACPAVVSYVEKYKPELLDLLIRVVSPMIAHARMIKKEYPGEAVVFIGPCAAKKQEALRGEYAGAVDVVLTFTETAEWLEEEGVHLENCLESDFERLGAIGNSRLFPLDGGMLRTGGIHSDVADVHALHLSGAGEVMGLLDSPGTLERYSKVEPLFCAGGCVNGPGIRSGKNVFERRLDVIEYAKKAVRKEQDGKSVEIAFAAGFRGEPVNREEVSEDHILKVFERTGKTDAKFQLDCGACGYGSCIENAKAVARGMAEPEMCIPYMRRLSQQRSDRIIETSPNGVVILNSELCIMKMNAAFEKMFQCSSGILGRRISYLINADGFRKLLTGNADKYESIQVRHGVKYHEILYALRDEEQYVGIFSDISRITYDDSQLDVIKAQMVAHAREFLEHQVKFAQEMAHYLGKSTAQSEEMAQRLIDLYKIDTDIGRK